MVLVRTVTANGVDLAQIYDLKSFEGQSFPTPPTFPMQFGVGSFPDGRAIPPHVHTHLERRLSNTSEFLYILDGALRVEFLDADGVLVDEHRLTANMALLQVSGGHRLTFEPGSRYFEIKQGPYLGRDADKRDVAM